MTEQQEQFRKLKVKVLRDLMEIRDLMQVPNKSLWVVNAINRTNEKLRYCLEPINRPANQPKLNFVNPELVQKLLENPIELTQALEGQPSEMIRAISNNQENQKLLEKQGNYQALC